MTCDDTLHEKPDPRYFAWLKDMPAREGIRQSEILHVGQSQFHDITVAQALGWRTCWIERYAGQQLHSTCWMVDKPVQPDWHFETLRDLADAVESEATQASQCMALPLFAEGLAMSAAQRAVSPHQARFRCFAMRPSGYARLSKGWRKTIRLLNFSIPISSCSRRSMSSWKRATLGATTFRR